MSDKIRELLNRIVPRLDAGGPNPIDPDLHHCEWALYQERERIHAEFEDVLAQQPAPDCGCTDYPQHCYSGPTCAWAAECERAATCPAARLAERKAAAEHEAQAFGTVCGGDATHNTVIVHVDGQVPQMLWTIGTSVALTAPAAPAPAPAPAAQEPAEVYAVRYLSHWDGEGDDVYVLALKHNGVLVTHEGGVKIDELLEYTGDKILNVWPLQTTPAAEQPDTVKVPREQLVDALQKEALTLCDAVENVNDLPPVKYALQAGRAVNKVRDAVRALLAGGE